MKSKTKPISGRASGLGLMELFHKQAKKLEWISIEVVNKVSWKATSKQ
jgi:hypothetical protein